MKTLVFIQSDYNNKGGIARVTSILLNELARTGRYNIIAVSFSKINDKLRYELNEHIRIIDFPIDKFAFRKHTFLAALYLRKNFKSDFDGIFIVDEIGMSVPCYMGLRQCRNAKFIAWTHVTYFNGKSYGFSGVGKRIAAKKFDYIVTLTKEDREYYRKIDKRNIAVQIYNPADRMLAKSDYDLESKTIISVGELCYEKGFHLLIQAAAPILKKYKDWQLKIYGEGSEREKLESLIVECGMEENIFLMGYHNNIYDEYRKSAFYVFPSLLEGFPMTMVEALSIGLPMIAFDFKCGPKDMITNGVNGYIVHDFNVQEMSKRIEELIENPQKRISMHENSCCNMEEVNMDYVIAKWEALFK